MVIKHTRDAHQLVKEGLPKQRLSELPEVSAQHGGHGVDVVPVDQGREGVTTLFKFLLVLVNVSLEIVVLPFIYCWHICLTHVSPSDPEDALVPHAVGVDVLDTALYHQRNLFSCRLKILVKRASEHCGQPSRLGLHLLPEKRNSMFAGITLFVMVTW